MRGDRSGDPDRPNRRRRSDLFDRYALADRLHVTLSAIDAMSLEEFNGWRAFYQVQAEKEK